MKSFNANYKEVLKCLQKRDHMNSVKYQSIASLVVESYNESASYMEGLKKYTDFISTRKTASEFFDHPLVKGIQKGLECVISNGDTKTSIVPFTEEESLGMNFTSIFGDTYFMRLKNPDGSEKTFKIFTCQNTMLTSNQSIIKGVDEYAKANPQSKSTPIQALFDYASEREIKDTLSKIFYRLDSHAGCTDIVDITSMTEVLGFVEKVATDNEHFICCIDNQIVAVYSRYGQLNADGSITDSDDSEIAVKYCIDFQDETAEILDKNVSLFDLIFI